MPVIGIAMLSVAIAVVLGSVQRRPLGDDPVLMIAAGSVLALLAGALRLGSPWRLGAAAMAGFPVGALIDLLLHGGHDLLPFEFVFYAAYCALGMAVAAVARRARA